MFVWQKVIMKINVNYLFHRKKRLPPSKDKHNVQIVHVSLFLPCPRVLLIVRFMTTIVRSPDIVQILRTVGSFTVLYWFGMYLILNLILFNKHVEKDFLQHGLGTPYSNSACFDKDDIWKFLQFLVQCMSASLLFSLTLKIELYSKLVLGLPRPHYWHFNKTFHPEVIFSLRLLRKKNVTRKIFYI